VVASKRGLPSGLSKPQRTVVLMLEETIVTETPPLYNHYGKIGGQVEGPLPVTEPSASCLGP
jgi:hypothetical protein